MHVKVFMWVYFYIFFQILKILNFLSWVQTDPQKNNLNKQTLHLFFLKLNSLLIKCSFNFKLYHNEQT